MLKITPPGIQRSGGSTKCLSGWNSPLGGFANHQWLSMATQWSAMLDDNNQQKSTTNFALIQLINFQQEFLSSELWEAPSYTKDWNPTTNERPTGSLRRYSPCIVRWPCAMLCAPLGSCCRAAISMGGDHWQQRIRRQGTDLKNKTLKAREKMKKNEASFK